MWISFSGKICMVRPCPHLIIQSSRKSFPFPTPLYDHKLKDRVKDGRDPELFRQILDANLYTHLEHGLPRSLICIKVQCSSMAQSIVWWNIPLLGIPNICQDPKITNSHFAIGSGLIESKALHYHYLDLPILRTSADLEYHHCHLVDFVLIVLHLSDHMIIGCRHPGCLTME